MAEAFIRSNPSLEKFVLSDVKFTGTRIGGGAYGRVDEVSFTVFAAAKCVYNFLQEDGEEEEVSKAAAEFVRECRLMSTLRHPNIVLFLGLCFLPNSRLPALVMERLVISLHDLLDRDSNAGTSHNPISFFSLDLKCSVLHNVANGLSFLHGRNPPIVHRDLSARNILISSDMVAKIADLGVARIIPHINTTATLTKGPGAIVYMPPEAFAPSSVNEEKSIYDSSIDIFSFGIVAIFTIGENFPCDPLEPTYFDTSTKQLIARTELQRRSKYLQDVYNSVGVSSNDHPLIKLIQECLQNLPNKRPQIGQVVRLLDEACAGVGPNDSNKLQLLSILQSLPQSSNHNLRNIVQDLVITNSDLLSRLKMKERELSSAQLQLGVKQEKLRHTDIEIQRMGEIIMEKKLEVIRAKEDTQNKQQQIFLLEEQMRLKEVALAHTQNRHQSSKDSIAFGCHISGPGVTSATVNHPTHVYLELHHIEGGANLSNPNVTATLQHVIDEMPNRRKLFFRKSPSPHSINVVKTSPLKFDIPYIPTKRGKYNLSVRVNNNEISQGPIVVAAFARPSDLSHPVRVIKGLSTPYGIAFNSRGEMVVSEMVGHRVSICDRNGHRVSSFGSRGDSKNQMKYPRGLAIDDHDHIYVSSEHKLQKFKSNGELIKCIGQRGRKEGEFNDPHGLTLHNNLLYVCDCDNHRIQVLDLDFNFIKCIGSRGHGRGEFDAPDDVKFDNDGNMFVAESGNERVQVLDGTGKYLLHFGHDGKEKLGVPLGLHVADKYVYVSNRDDKIMVYETSGSFVSSFGKYGQKKGEFYEPRCITSCPNGLIYISDFTNNRVQIF